MFEPGPLRDLLGRVPSGAGAAAVEAGREQLADLDEDLLVELIAAAHRFKAWSESVLLAGMVELLARRDQAPPDPAGGPGFAQARQRAADLARRSTVAEVALATGTSEYAASARLSAALALHRRLPRAKGLFEAGALGLAESCRPWWTPPPG